jgi:hypothetical protein
MRSFQQPLRQLRPVWSGVLSQCANLTTKNTPRPAPSTNAQPLGAYYENILNYPLPSSTEISNTPVEPSVQKAPSTNKPTTRKPRTPKSATASTNPSTSAKFTKPPPTPTQLTPQEKARIVFGSSLAGPRQRAGALAEKQAKTTIVAGVSIPPRPEEPDNCCMSGCVNCVWDLFREDMEAWSTATAEAKKRLKAEGGTSEALSMDDDGGGSESNWQVSESAKLAKDLWDDDLYQNVPVGIREFMKQEKRLKERHAREGTAGG